MVYTLLVALFNQAGGIVLVALLLSRFRFFTRLITQDRLPFRNLLLLAVFFSLFGIIRTYSGIPIKGALANARVVGVFVGGLIGGPFVGILAGIIAGVHRWAIDIGGFTAFACMISTISEGALAGLLSTRFYRSEKKWLFAFYGGAAAETLQMILILVLVTPFSDAFELVKIIGIPMIVANAVGISMFIAIVESIFKEQNRIAAVQSRTVLQITNKTINLFRQGLTEDTTRQAALIIKQMTSAAAVAFTNREKILAHVGEGSDHHVAGLSLMTNITRKVIQDGKTRVANSKPHIACNQPECKLKGAVIVPLKEKNKVIGSLKLYKIQENAITPVDIQLAEGLATLFSTQLELSRIEEQAVFLKEAELKALQAQINPHFLFNALNTIVSLIRSSPDRARELLLKLGAYFRKTLYHKGNISLADEIENIKNYLEIEQARFGDKLKVTYTIPASIDVMIPPFTLQPLVENALKHGLFSKIEGGSIEIKAEKKGKNLLLTVKDDGIGIPEEDLARLLDSTIETESVGLRNVHNRLRYYFGESSGLSLESIPGKGTLVSVIIPGE